MKLDDLLENVEERGDNHAGASRETPLRDNAFDLDDQEKITLIQDDGMLSSSISTITTSSLMVGVSYFCMRSKLFSLAVSLMNGSLSPHHISTASVMNAKVQCVNIFFIIRLCYHPASGVG